MLGEGAGGGARHASAARTMPAQRPVGPEGILRVWTHENWERSLLREDPGESWLQGLKLDLSEPQVAHSGVSDSATLWTAARLSPPSFAISQGGDAL